MPKIWPPVRRSWQNVFLTKRLSRSAWKKCHTNRSWQNVFLTKRLSWSWQNVFLTKRLRRSWQNVFLTKRLLTTFGLAINCDYLSTVFTSDHPCPEYIVYSQCKVVCGETSTKNKKWQDRLIARAHILCSSIHTGEKLHQCTKCSFWSAQSSNLKQHMIRHSTTVD